VQRKCNPSRDTVGKKDLWKFISAGRVAADEEGVIQHLAARGDAEGQNK